MQTPPTREEILAKYRDVITVSDFEVLLAESPPSPTELQSEGVWLQVLGSIRGWCVYLKHKGGIVVGAVILWGSFRGGVEYLANDTQFVYSQAQHMVEVAQQHLDQPATSYAFILPESDHKPKKNDDWYDVPPGTGITSFNADWGIYS